MDECVNSDKAAAGVATTAGANELPCGSPDAAVEIVAKLPKSDVADGPAEATGATFREETFESAKSLCVVICRHMVNLNA